MAVDDRPWWGKKHTLYGGETFTSKETEDKIGIKVGDRFRVEKKGVNITLSPHPLNQGTLRDSNNEKKPLTLEKITAPKFERAYSMTATVTEQPNQPVLKTLFLVEMVNGGVAIKANVNDPGSSDGTASVER